MKAQNFALLATIILLSVSGSTPAYASGMEQVDGEEAIDVILEIAEHPSNEDENWLIVSDETTITLDKITGQEVIIRNVMRIDPRTTTSSCAGVEEYRDGMTASTCTYVGATSRAISVTAGGVTGYATNYAYGYYSVDDYYKLYRLEIWWTRTSMGWSVRDAYTGWGCNGSCAICPDNYPYWYYYSNGPFTPSWIGNTTYTYIYTSSGWPIIKSTQFGIVTGGNSSTVRSPFGVYYSLSMFADY